jgi:hypothetical protein
VLDGSSRIPVILVDPRRAGGKRVEDVTRAVDIAPTILESLGFPVPAGMDGVSLKDCIDGRSIIKELIAFQETGIWFTRIPGLSDGHLHYPDLPQLLEVPDKTLGTLAIKHEYRDRTIRARDRAARSAHWKLTYMPMASGEAQLALFDILHDPACRQDVLASHPQVAAELQRALCEWMRAEERMPMVAVTDPGPAAGCSEGRELLRPHAA